MPSKAATWTVRVKDLGASRIDPDLRLEIKFEMSNCTLIAQGSDVSAYKGCRRLVLPVNGL